MTACQKWNLLILNSKDVFRFFKVEFKEFREILYIENVRKIPDFSVKLDFSLFLLSDMFQNIFDGCSVRN
jgi:hypothetical protein